MNPAPLGLIKRKGAEGEINVDGSQLGTTYLGALTNSMKHLHPKTIRLKNVKEDQKGVLSIISTLKRGLENLDVSNSTLSLRAIAKINEWMDQQAAYGTLCLKELTASS